MWLQLIHPTENCSVTITMLKKDENKSEWEKKKQQKLSGKSQSYVFFCFEKKNGNTMSMTTGLREKERHMKRNGIEIKKSQRVNKREKGREL